MTNKKDKIANPLKFYKTPNEVDQDKDLTRTDKIKVLKNWLDDITLRQIAEEENMLGIYRSTNHVAEIEKLLRQYEET